MKTIDIIKIWNSYCIENNALSDLIYPLEAISAKSLPCAYFMVSSIGIKYFKSDVDAIDAGEKAGTDELVNYYIC